ncbi:TPA: tRNA dihydrouridine synthase DusB [Candidatus Poribacteria bacterium]|nr:tRNA dihydrouridine synthase DusB [Candidatus Poribacteria bacterium]
MNSLKIGTVILPNNIFLAPMSGFTELAFRLIVKEHGVGLVYTSMLNARGFLRGNRKTFELAEVSQKERPIAMQIYGSDPEIMACAAQIIEPECDIIDLNFGCPAPKIISNGYGAVFLKKPRELKTIVARVVSAVKCPVTVKFRSGWDEKSINAKKIAQIIEDSGAAAMALHPRTCKQGFDGKADWRIIADVKQSVSIPVIGSGDITRPEDAKAMLDSTGCDAVMIGRASLGNPWIFSRTIEYLKNGVLLPQPTREDRISNLLKFAAVMFKLKNEFHACREIRKHICWYVKGFTNATEIRRRVNEISSFQELKDIFAGSNK